MPTGGAEQEVGKGVLKVKAFAVDVCVVLLSEVNCQNTKWVEGNEVEKRRKHRQRWF